jgi:prefoldin subunit 5
MSMSGTPPAADSRIRQVALGIVIDEAASIFRDGFASGDNRGGIDLAAGIAVGVALLFIGVSLFGIFGVWLIDRKATEVAGKVFGLVETAVKVADAGVARVDELIGTSRTEVRQASDTITSVGARAEANRAVLIALNERLDTTLASRIAKMQRELTPVRDAMGSIGNAISVLNSLPMMADRAPRLASLDDAFNRLDELSADTTQLRSTLRALVAENGKELSAETVATLSGFTQRIEARLGEVQAKVQGVRADVAALQVRMDARQSKLLLIFNLFALLATLMLAWILYSQVVVIRHYRRRTGNGTVA